MPVDQESKRLAFARLVRNLSNLSEKPQPESVHQFRTYSRRVESFLFELVPELNGNQKKLLRSLKRLRKKAGRVRDLDVQITALRGLKISQSPAGRSQLLHGLTEERAKRLRKLEKSFDKETTGDLRKRLRRAEKESVIADAADPLAAGLRLFLELGKDGAPLNEKKLHQYRIVGKRARYLAEFAGENPEAQSVVAQLKQMQDTIGDWHDWFELTAKAERLLKDDQNSALVVALRNLTRAKFRQAVHALATAQKSLQTSAPKKTASAQNAASAVA
ncbi:MAG TPA: CHAD domain-containing protein [Terriglobales bacterium]|jgi:CHAD domain-containing protein|nr:CHAD domain-containing protein [Terriglobales bacterium]